MKTHIFTAVIAALLFAFDADAATVRFVCKSPSGQAYYPDDATPAWSRDQIRNGAIELAIDSKGAVLLRIIDVRGKIYIPAKDGAVITRTSQVDPKVLLSITAFYPNDGIQETYAVTHGSRLLWTVARDGQTSGQTTKVGAYTAACTEH